MLILTAAFSQPASTSQFMEQIKKAPNDSTKVRLYGKLTRLYINTKPDSAIYYLGEGLKLAKEINDREGEGMMLSQLGLVNEVHGNLELAKKYELDALGIFKAIKKQSAIAVVENGLGVIESKKGNYAAAATYFLDALSIHKGLKDNFGIMQGYIKLGTVNDLSGNMDKALEYFNIAWEMNHNDTLSNAYYSLSNNIGIIYGRKGNFKKALEYFEAGIKTSNTPRFIDVHISLLNNAMKAYGEIGNKQKALEYHQLVVGLARKYEIPEEEARTLINFADVNKDNPSLELVYLKRALVIADSVESRQIAVDVYQAMADVYKQQKNYQAALTATETYQKIEDSLLNIEKTKEIASLFSSYELNESKTHIQELELVNQKRTNERNLVIVGIAAILLILLVGYYYYRKASSLNGKLHESNKIKDKLFSIIGHDLKSPIGGLVQTLELLEDDDLTPDERKFVIGELRKQTQLSLDTLNALLKWGETQLKGISVNPVKFQTKEIIKRNIDILAKHAAVKSITVIDHTEDSTSLFVDQNHFDFVVRNLLSNAIKFTNPDGKVEINAVENPKENTVVFSVKDNGMGIGKEQQQQFLKSNINVSFGTKGEKGTGLGLLLTKEFIQANNGRVWLESQEGHGTTFYFSLKKG